MQGTQINPPAIPPLLLDVGYCVVKLDGQAGLGRVSMATKSLREAQAALGEPTWGQVQAIYAMVDNKAGDLRYSSLPRKWAGGAMWWYDDNDFPNMEAACNNKATKRNKGGFKTFWIPTNSPEVGKILNLI